MVDTNIEAAITGMRGSTLEQIADDLLERDGFEVQPTSTRGADNKRDSIVKKDGEIGIVHCSTNRDIEPKIKQDAQKSFEKDEEFDFFYFFTSADRATVMRDRLEEEISEQYGFRTRIRDFEYLRNTLVGNKDNHDIIQRNFEIDPGGAVNSVEKLAESLHNREQGSRLKQQPRLAVEEWKVTVADETVPLFQPESFEKTQELISLTLTNYGSGKAYNLQASLCVYPIGDLSNPDIQDIVNMFNSAQPTSDLRRDGQDVGESPKNYLSMEQSMSYSANTMIWMHDGKRSAFSADVTPPFHPESEPPEGLATGVKIFYDDESGSTTERVVFAGIGPVPTRSLGEFYSNLTGYIPIGSEQPIRPVMPESKDKN